MTVRKVKLCIFLIIISILMSDCTTFKADIFNKTVSLKYGYIDSSPGKDEYIVLTTFPMDDEKTRNEIKKKMALGEKILGDCLTLSLKSEPDNTNPVVILFITDVEFFLKDGRIGFRSTNSSKMNVALKLQKDILISHGNDIYTIDLSNLEFRNDGGKDEFVGNTIFKGKLKQLSF